MAAEYRMTLAPQTLDDAAPDARPVLEKAKAQVGFIPNMYAGMVNSPGVLDTYLDGYQAFREASGFTPAEQETVFLTISRVNGCAYCMGAHSMLAEKKSGLADAVTAALRDDQSIPDPKVGALSTFTRQMVVKRGLISKADGAAFLGAGYTERHMLEVVLAIAVKTLSNYSNHLFHTKLDDMFAGHSWSPPEKEAA